MWIDTHAHLAEAIFDEDRAQIIERLHQAKIAKVLLIGSNLDGANRALDLAMTSTLFDVAVGFHPQDVQTIRPEDWIKMEQLQALQQVVALGEIGLDYYWEKDPQLHVLQQDVFVRQLKHATQLNKPVIIHSRDAMQDTYTLLKEHAPPRKGIMHCFSGSLEMALKFVDLGFYISLAGPLTFHNARIPKEVAIGVGLDHLMIETDSPYLAPHPHRGKRNESAYVELVGLKMAELKGLNPTDVQKALTQNYLNFTRRKEL